MIYIKSAKFLKNPFDQKDLLVGDLLNNTNCLGDHIFLVYDETYSIAHKLEQVNNMLNCGLISRSEAKKLLGFK